MLKTTTEEQLSEYIHSISATEEEQSAVLKSIAADLLARDGMVSNKSIILALVERLEIESDIVKCDLYRCVLESVLQSTADDI